MDKKNKKISTSALSKQLNLTSKELFAKFERMQWIDGVGKEAKLTDLGKLKGGEYRVSDRYGQYIVWPNVVRISDAENPEKKHVVGSFIGAIKLGKEVNLSGRKINALLNELGWIEKGVKGWIVTKQGKRVGGMQQENQQSGIPFALWPDTILKNKAFVDTIQQLSGSYPSLKKETQPEEKEELKFREKFPATFRTTDGHMVRSKAEMIIDNWLYMAELVHAYERRLPVEEELYCDFYIPSGRVYIEYWGYDNKKAYLARKEKKLAIYQQYDFNLIELTDNDVANLDDVMPKLLLKFGVKTY